MSSDEESAVPVGTILDGKFRVTREIGRGGMAVVYEAENVDIKKRVAVKVLAAELTHSKIITERFLREARAASAIRSPYICDVYDVGTFDRRPFLVMELLEGHSLYDRLADVRQLDVDETLRITRQVCRALAKAHSASVVHRDLKPENIFLTRNEDGRTVSKIVDFGLAKFYEAENEGGDKARLTKEGALFGTPAYMSPEQAKAQIDVDHRADLWALACIVYECLTGRTVWNVDQGVAMILAQIAGAPIPRPSRVRGDLPPSFDDWFARALDRDINRRFQTAREFSERLEGALIGEPGTVGRAPISTTDEGTDVDNMLAGNYQPRLPQGAPSAPGGMPPSALPSSLPPEAKSRGPGFAIGALLFASLLALGGYGVWFYVMHPGQGALGALRSTIGVSDSSAAPQETEPFALRLNAGQLLLAKGDVAGAAQEFSAAFEESKQNAARSLVAHTEVAEGAEGTAKCRLAGLGHPRPFAPSTEAASLPGVARTTAGVVVTWAETDAKPPRHRRAYSTLLDGALRRIAPITDLTPEGEMIQEPAVFQGPKGPILTYWESATARPGAYIRQLDAQGRIAGPPKRLSDTTEKQSYPTIAIGATGDVWTVWTERTHGRVFDLKARRYSADLSPLSGVLRLSAYTPPRTGNSIASKAHVSVVTNRLLIVYALERDREHHILAIRVPIDDAVLGRGGVEPAEGESAEDRIVGKLIPVSTAPGKHNMPDIACATSGCFIAWDDEKAGAHVAMMDGESGELLWRNELGPKALRPAVGRRENEVAVAWFDESRVRIATLDRNGVAKPSDVARVNGYQPPPDVIADDVAGEWLIAWRDFEAAKHEAFVLRARCQ